MKHSGSAAVLLALAACNASPITSTAPRGGKADGRGSPADTDRFATFNAGLARNYVALAEERVAPLIDAVKGLDADVLCLQEVWDDTAAVVAGVADAFPYSYSVDTTEDTAGSPPSCTLEQLAPLQACVAESCAGSADLSACALAHCGAVLAAQSPECLTCMAANVAKPINELFGKCLTSASKYGFDGRNGLLLLAKRDLANTESLTFDSYLTRRAVLHAEVDTVQGTTQVFCTHLTAALSEFPYMGRFGSWANEQSMQIDQLLEALRDSAGDESLAVVLGDLNAGPTVAGTDILGELEDNYLKLRDVGLDSPYDDQEAPLCTWCGTNTLVARGSSEKSDHILDHIFLWNIGSERIEARRIFDHTVTVTVTGNATETSLSDHYGILVDL